MAVALGKTFCSTTDGIARAINGMLKNSSVRIEFEPVSPEEGELWGTFALPVLKEYFPKLQEDPKITLVVMTVMILGGKVKISKKPIVEDNPNVTTPAS